MPRRKGRSNKKDTTSEESDSSSLSDSESDNTPSKQNTRNSSRRILDSSDDTLSNQSSTKIPAKKRNIATKSTGTRPSPQVSDDNQQAKNTKIPAKKGNIAKKSTGTRPSSQVSGGNQQAKSVTISPSVQRKRGRPSKASNLSSSVPTATKQIATLAISDHSSDEDDANQRSKKGKNSTKTVNAKKQLLGSSLNNSNSVSSQHKRGRVSNASVQNTPSNSSQAGPSSSKRLPTFAQALVASDDSSDDDVIRPTPGARNSVMKNFKSSPKRMGTYSPLKKDVINNSGFPSKDSMKQLVNNCVHYLLIANQKKYVIRKADIRKNVFKDNIDVKICASVIKQAGQTLRQVYGLELMKLENQKDQFIIHNNFEIALHFSEFSDSKQTERGLIAYLLTVIFMNGNCITEDDLWSSLEPFGMSPLSKKPHPCFGDVKKFITSELVRQMYFEYKKIPNSDPLRHEFKWGVRAKLEVKKKDLLDFACEVYGDCKPEDWILQYKDATEGETIEEEL